MTALVVLESMWGWRSPGSVGDRAPQWFPINHANHSGKRLHRLLKVNPREGNVWVTNACPEVQATAGHHGTPDPSYLGRNIIEFPSAIDLLLVGGKIAGDAFYDALKVHADALFEKLRGARVIHIPHPAWRMWSNSMEDTAASLIAARGAYKTADIVSTLGRTRVHFKRCPIDAPFEVWIFKAEAV